MKFVKQSQLIKTILLLSFMTMGSIGVKAEEEIILSESFNDGLPSGWSNDAYGGG